MTDLWTVDQAAEHWGVSKQRARAILRSRGIRRGYPAAEIRAVSPRQGARTDEQRVRANIIDEFNRRANQHSSDAERPKLDQALAALLDMHAEADSPFQGTVERLPRTSATLVLGSQGSGKSTLIRALPVEDFTQVLIATDYPDEWQNLPLAPDNHLVDLDTDLPAMHDSTLLAVDGVDFCRRPGGLRRLVAHTEAAGATLVVTTDHVSWIDPTLIEKFETRVYLAGWLGVESSRSRLLDSISALTDDHYTRGWLQVFLRGGGTYHPHISDEISSWFPINSDERLFLNRQRPTVEVPPVPIIPGTSSRIGLAHSPLRRAVFTHASKGQPATRRTKVWVLAAPPPPQISTSAL